MNSAMWITAAAILGAVQLAAVAVMVWSSRSGRKAQNPPSGLPAGDLRKLARRLHRVTNSVAGDVEEHHKQIEQLHDQLTSIPSSDGQPMTEVFLNTVARAIAINEWLQKRLCAAEDKLQQQAREIESHINEARTDALTGLPNRRAFDDELIRRVAESQRKQTTFCLMMLDIDRFKSLNDRYGHPAGDCVLRRLAKILRNTFREMDMVARFGGEEFAVILPSTSAEDGKLTAQRVGATVASSEFRSRQDLLRVTLSIGLAAVRTDDSPASLLQRADKALYASKRGGRNCGHFHDGLMCQEVVFALDTDDPVDRDRSGQDDLDLKTVCHDLRTRLAEVTAGA